MKKEQEIKIRNLKVFLLSTGVFCVVYALMFYFNRLFFSAELVGYVTELSWESVLWDEAKIHKINVLFKFCTCLFISLPIIIIVCLKVFKEKIYIKNFRMYVALAFIIPTVLFTLILVIKSTGDLAPYDVLAQFDTIVNYWTNDLGYDKSESLDLAYDLLKQEIWLRRLLLLTLGLVSIAASVVVDLKFSPYKNKK